MGSCSGIRLHRFHYDGPRSETTRRRGRAVAIGLRFRLSCSLLEDFARFVKRTLGEYGLWWGPLACASHRRRQEPPHTQARPARSGIIHDFRVALESRRVTHCQYGSLRRPWFHSTCHQWTCANKGVLLRKRRPRHSLFRSLRDGIAWVGL